jgi:phenylacetate-CoA ligase
LFRNAKALYQVLHDIKLSKSEIESLASKRLKSVLIASYKYVPYYRKIMQDIGYNPLKDYTGPKDLAKFPITTKKDLKANRVSLFLKENADTAKLFSDHTSGSTGMPLKIYRDWNERAFQVAKYLRVLFKNGYSVKDKILSLCGPTRLGGNKTILQKFGFIRRLAVSYLFPIPQIVDILLEYKPQVLSGNRSHVDLIALELLKRKIQLKSLKLISVGAEMIHDNSRNLYKQAFGLNTIENYGTCEMGLMAYEISGTEGLYLNEDLTYFEFLDKNGNSVSPGEPGRVVVTDLLAKTMPFIRYDQGDYAIIKIFTGIDGKPVRRIVKIIGRDDDQIILPDGSTRPYHVFFEIMNKLHGIMQFRITQKTKSYFEIKIAADHNYFNKIYDQIINSLYDSFPKYCKFDLLRVDAIEPDPTGKTKNVISDLKKVINNY